MTVKSGEHKVTSSLLTLTERDKHTLALLCDTFVPAVKSSERQEFFNRTATSIGVEREIERVVAEFNDDQRAQFGRILTLLESKVQNLILNGTFRKFSEMSQETRQDFIFRKFAISRFALKRTAFQAMKRMICFTYYGLVPENQNSNPNWQEIGYTGRGKIEENPSEDSLTDSAIVPSKGQIIDCDVCVVGSGAGGSLIAESLAKLGWHLVVIDSGDYFMSKDFTSRQEYDLTRNLFEQSGRAATKDLAFSLLEGHTVGGSTVVNWNTSIKPPDWLREEWETFDGISGLRTKEFDACVDYVWSGLRVNREESQINPNNSVLADGCKKLGLLMPEDYDIIWRNAAGCKGRCDYCTFGCEYGAKQSTTRNFLLEAKRFGTKFIFGAEVQTVERTNGRASGVRATLLENSANFEIKSRAVVIAAGSINTPAILLRSGLKRNVGRNLKLHPTTAISGIYTKPINMWRGPPQTIKVTKWLNLDGAHHGFWIEAVPAHPALYASAIPWKSGKAHKELMLKMPHSSGTIVLLRESGSGTVGIDSGGRPVCNYSLSSLDRSHLERGLVQTAKILAASGAWGIATLHVDGVLVETSNHSQLSSTDLDRFEDEIKSRQIAPNKISLFSAHIMGSAKMGREENSFCDDSAQSYELPMLFIGDASALPSSPGVNPMITIMSLARRNAIRIHEILKAS
jgi:choline dehydrogenase-like flavoprotein